MVQVNILIPERRNRGIEKSRTTSKWKPRKVNRKSEKLSGKM